MSKPAATKTVGYIATIRKVGNEFIAYDQDGNWRTRGLISGFNGNSIHELACYLYHADEVGKVTTGSNGVATVEVLEW